MIISHLESTEAAYEAEAEEDETEPADEERHFHCQVSTVLDHQPGSAPLYTLPQDQGDPKGVLNQKIYIYIPFVTKIS